MGLHAAAGSDVTLDWHVSGAVPALHREAGERGREANSAGLPDTGGASRAKTDSRAEIDRPSPRSGRMIIAHRFIGGGSVKRTNFESVKRTVEILNDGARNENSVARFAGSAIHR